MPQRSCDIPKMGRSYTSRLKQRTGHPGVLRAALRKSSYLPYNLLMRLSIRKNHAGGVLRRSHQHGPVGSWFRHLLLPEVDSAAELNQVVSDVFRKCYPLVLILGILSLVLGALRTALYGWYPMLIWHLPMCLLFLSLFCCRRHISPSLVFRILLGLLFVDALHSLFTLGPAGTGMTSLAMIATLAGVFIGVRAGIAFLSVGTIGACLIGTGF